MENDEEKERTILKFYIERIFQMFLLKLGIMEYELGEFIDKKRNKHYYIYLILYHSLILFIGLSFLFYILYENPVFHWINYGSLVVLMLFQNVILSKFPYNYSRYRYEKKTTLERLGQLNLILNSNSLAKNLVKENYKEKFEEIKSRIDYFSNFFKPKRLIMKEIGIIAIMTSLITRIIYDLISSFSYTQIDSDFYFKIFLFFSFVSVVFLPSYITNRKIALSGKKGFNKAFNIDFYLKIFREFTKMINMVFKAPDYLPDMLEIKGVAELFKDQKSKFLNNALEKMKNLQKNQ